MSSNHRGNNLGLAKSMALDTLGNAYMYLRNEYATTTWKTAEGQALLDAADVLHAAFNAAKDDFHLLDFTLDIRS